MTLLVDDPDVRLYVGESCDVLAAHPVRANAIVTSPPYAGQRGAVAPDAYPEWIVPHLRMLKEMLLPTGSMMLNLGRTFRDGEESSYIEETVAAARSVGWRRLDTLIWRKLNAHPFGAPCYLINEHEYVHWLGLHTNAYRGYTAETRRPPAPETVARRARGGLRGPKNRERGGYVPKQRTNFNPAGVRPGSVFDCFIGRQKGIKHGEPMALELAEYLVMLSCPPGGLVLDPFAGSGTTGIAARRRGRRAVLVELDEERALEAAERLAGQHPTLGALEA